MVLNKPYSSSMEKEVRKAANIINAFFDSRVDADSAIPVELIKGCAGLAFLTVVKAGMIWTGKLGTGVVIARLDDGSWSPPSGIGTAGIGFGAEIGGEIIDFMIILGSQSALKTFKQGTQVSVGAGLDLAVGPVGRAAGASVNAGSGGLSGNFTYSHAKGMFAGIGLHGSTIMVRGDMNSKFYGRDVSPQEILNGHVAPPAGSCDVLYDAIQRITMADISNSSSGRRSTNSNASAYPSYGDYNNNASARSLSHSMSSGSRHSLDASSSSASQQQRNSFGSASTASIASAVPSTPDANDPRLRRYGQYKSERELYAQFQTQKSAPSSAASAQTSGYGQQQASSYAAPAAAAAGGYAATGAYNQYAQQHPPAAAASNAPGPALSTHTHPTNPSLTYKSYPAPTNPSTYVPSATQASSSSSFHAPAPRQQQVVPPLPPAAHGAETKQVYQQVLAFVETRCPYANVQVFKDNCRLFGQDAMTLDAFYSYTSSLCTKALLKEFVPLLVRLLPTQEKREALWTQYCRDVLLLKV